MFKSLGPVHVILLLSLLASAICAPTAHAQPPSTRLRREYLKQLEQPIVLRGDYFKAVLAAYTDFAKKLSGNETAAVASAGGPKELEEWLSKIEDYDIRVSERNGIIVVGFLPTVRGKFLPVLGGSAIYEIDRDSFKIRSRTSSK